MSAVLRAATEDVANSDEFRAVVAEMGVGAASYTVAQIYFNGYLDVPKNERQALLWFRRAADAGYAPAMTDIGASTPMATAACRKTEAQALNWLRKAADLGDGRAMTGIGWMYEGGLGGSIDDRQAVNWYRKAAATGFSATMKYRRPAYASGGASLPEDEVEVADGIARLLKRATPGK